MSQHQGPKVSEGGEPQRLPEQLPGPLQRVPLERKFVSKSRHWSEVSTAAPSTVGAEDIKESRSR